MELDGHVCVQGYAAHDVAHFLFRRRLVGKMATRVQRKHTDNRSIYKHELVGLCVQANAYSKMWFVPLSPEN
jgi:hypothetical protein